MFEKIKKYLKERNNSISDRIIPNKQIFKLMHKHFKRVGNFGTATLILADIDNFRNLVEMYGEEIGEKVLREVSQRFAALLPLEASISIMHTDGILVFIPDEGAQSRVEKLCKKMLEVVKLSSHTEELQNISLSASIGVCTYPQSGSTVKELLEGVDLATFVSKRSGGNKVTSYYATLSNDEKNNMIQYEEIRTAIQKKEFVLYYQPIIDITNQNLFGAEALMRWNHP
ncbi:diguanylate cyclase, partial [bacterium]|nr:diguanylate cyclase [bacterium]